jgi:hypothetical protein
VLGVGFIVDKYKKNPKVNIFLDDRLIDRIELDNNTALSEIPNNLEYSYFSPSVHSTDVNDPKEDLRVVDNIIKLFELGNDDDACKIMYTLKPSQKIIFKKKMKTSVLTKTNKSINNWIDAYDKRRVPKKFKIYVLDESVLLGKNEISLQVENDDSNYTNGFMTKSTLIDLRHIFLLPRDYIQIFKNKGEKLWESIIKIIPHEYKGIGKIVTNKEFEPAYPFPFKYIWNDEWNGKKSMKYSNGGSGVLRLPLKIRDGVVMFDPNYAEDENLNKDELPWLEDFLDKFPDKQTLIYNGLSREQAVELLQNKQIPAFKISRLFASLVHRGMLNKYIR